MKSIALALAVVLAPLAARAQEPPKPEVKPAPKAEVVRASEWPKLAGDVLATAKTDVERLRKAGTAAMAEQADASLTAAGAGIVPLLLPVLGKERDVETFDRCAHVLEEVTTAEHTRLLAASFTDKTRPVRIWTLHRCAQFPDAGLREPAEAALAKAREFVQKDAKEEGVKEELYCAALCATSAGSHKGLDVISDYVMNKWGKYQDEIRTALEAVRDEAATEFAAKLTADTDRKKVVAGLNMLAGCGVRKAASLARMHLDSTDNSIRVAAINAMRGIVDGAPPIANLPVFDAIEMAKKWKERAP